MSYYSDVRLELTRYSFLTLIHYLKNNLPTDAKNPLDYVKIFRDRDNDYFIKDSVEIDYNSPPNKNTNVEPNIDL